MKNGIVGLNSMVIACLALLASSIAIGATERSLRNNPDIDNGLLTLALGNEMINRCPDIAPRPARVLPFIAILWSKALSDGFTRAEVEAHLESDIEKARMERLGRAWLAARDVDPDNDAELCALARDEIARQGAIGRMLKVK